MPNALSMGIREDEFWNMTMRRLNAHIEGFKLRQKTQDAEMHRMGIYVLKAVSVAVEHNLAGNKARSKYFEKPLMQEYEEQNKPLTEKELQKQRELFVAKLIAMQTNFELNHNEGDSGS